MLNSSETMPTPKTETSSIGVPGRSINPLASLFNHRMLALAIALLLLGVGLPFAWLKGSPSYQATAVVHVSPRFLKNLEGDKELEFSIE